MTEIRVYCSKDGMTNEHKVEGLVLPCVGDDPLDVNEVIEVDGRFYFSFKQYKSTHFYPVQFFTKLDIDFVNIILNNLFNSPTND
ncbi:hypothetical protein Phi39:1_gp35 [Cellulophaga phage phi39:1]|uniref:hypothetical protein n=1 Tax=Cellulophaga phage phi39:1 TaxID=1327993 RepID=UPI0003514D5B|nr:hypothetical protein Phi39:1_gp35 [Cellulophaga phage phi39:1]AGO49150.1 hypothetical protein Phi39:1_gp35 [Cellulophaga phage phi39:1]